MDTKTLSFLYISIIIGFISCKREVKPIDIINRSVQTHGSMDSWQNLKSLSFSKKSIVYNQDGSIKSESVQNQMFSFDGSFSSNIHSVLDSVTYSKRADEIYIDTKDSVYQPKEEELDKAQNLFSSALYVTSQPFQLVQSEASFELEKDTVIGQNRAFAIKVSYKNDGANSDQWTYYFDQDSYRVLACKVRHNKRVSFIENTSYDSSTPFLFNASRKSTIIERGSPSFVIAEYEYSNYEVQFH